MLSSITLLGPRTIERVIVEPISTMPQYLRKVPSPEEAFKNLECPVCLTMSDVPYLNCIHGHAICLSCFDCLEIKLCPLCKSAMCRAENFAIEKASLQCKFKCANPGCEVIETGERIREHMGRCNFKQYLPKPPKIISEKRYACIPTLLQELPGMNVPEIPVGMGLAELPSNSSNSLKAEGLSTQNGTEALQAQQTSTYSEPLVSWVDCTNAICPPNAVYAGVMKVLPEGKTFTSTRRIFVAKAFKGRKLIGGRFIPNEYGAVVYDSARKKSCKMMNYYKILTRAPEAKIEWINHTPGTDLPIGTVKSHTGVNGEIYYVARAKIEDGDFYTAGYVVHSQGCCYIGKGRKVFTQIKYQVLVVSLRE